MILGCHGKHVSYVVPGLHNRFDSCRRIGCFTNLLNQTESMVCTLRLFHTQFLVFTRGLIRTLLWFNSSSLNQTALVVFTKYLFLTIALGYTRQMNFISALSFTKVLDQTGLMAYTTQMFLTCVLVNTEALNHTCSLF